MPPYGFGRRFAPDDNDRRFLAAPVLTVAPEGEKFWTLGKILNQESTPKCVGYSARGWLLSEPEPTAIDVGPFEDAIYDGAQVRDEFADTPPAGGSSVRGAQKYLVELGEMTQYLWVDVVDPTTAWQQAGAWILEHGPGIAGTDWPASAMDPGPDGFLNDDYATEVYGHAYLVPYFSSTKGRKASRAAFGIANSWGEGWGDSGIAWIDAEDFGVRLSRSGEFCCPTQRPLLAPA